MNRSDIESLIDQKIEEHERRIGWISGIAGAVFMAALILLR
jgi:hypothetical protein